LRILEFKRIEEEEKFSENKEEPEPMNLVSKIPSITVFPELNTRLKDILSEEEEQYHSSNLEKIRKA